MMRRTLFISTSAIFLAASAQAGHTVTNDGDTATFLAQVIASAALLAAALYWKNTDPAAID